MCRLCDFHKGLGNSDFQFYSNLILALSSVYEDGLRRLPCGLLCFGATLFVEVFARTNFRAFSRKTWICAKLREN